jgi:hypothetical protein
MGQNNMSPTPAPIASTDAEAEPVIKHVAPAANAKVGASVQTITSPVAPGDNASITIKTTPTASCTITVVYNKIASKDSGLTQKVADDYGVVSWTWTVGGATPLGIWPATVTCVYGKNSAVVQGDLRVTKNGQ